MTGFSSQGEHPARPVVVIHTNDQQLLAALVCAHSLKARSRTPDAFDVRLLRLEETPSLVRRDGQRFIWWNGDEPSVWRRRDLQSFAPLRRKVPETLGFRGRALVLDPDVFAIGDIYELLVTQMDGRAIACRYKDEWRAERRLRSSAVMLLDCARLRHWDWERDIAAIFAQRLGLGFWLALLDEPEEQILPLAEEWNHHDTLTDRTKLLHNTQIVTQPWKTGLPADFHDHAPRGPAPVDRARRRLRRLVRRDQSADPRYRRHPDARQEALFFSSLRECVEQGSISERFLQSEIRKRHLRADAFELLERVGRD